MSRGRSRPIRLLAIAAMIATACALWGASGASAAKPPASFYGMSSQTPLSVPTIQRMGQANVGTLRIIFTWPTVDPTAAPGDTYWDGFNTFVLEAARNGMDVLPFLWGSPDWVANGIEGHKCSGATCWSYAPKSKAAVKAWSTFVGEAVDRFGPGGTLWAEHPEVTPHPITTWQIWNEQNSKVFYKPKPNPKAYVKLLKASNKAIHQRDKSADVVLGGMAELASAKEAVPGSKYLAKLYKVKKAKKYFNGFAPHPYGKTMKKITSQVDRYRRVIKKAHDSKVGMWVTEIGAGSAAGGHSLNLGEKGQAKLLKKIYKYFTKKRRKLHVEEVDWFSWQDSATTVCLWCPSSGLLHTDGSPKPSYSTFTKLTGGA